MRNLIWIVVAVVIAGGGYMLFTGTSFQDLAKMARGAADTAPATAQ